MADSKSPMKIFSHDYIFLIQGIAVEEFIEVDDWVKWIFVIVCVSTSGLAVLSLHSVEVVCSKISRWSKKCGILDNEIIIVAGRYKD